MSHALCPSATYAAATSDALAASRAHVRRSVEGAAALRSARAALADERVQHASVMDRLKRAKSPFDNYGCMILLINNPPMAMSIMASEVSILAS